MVVGLLIGMSEVPNKRMCCSVTSEWCVSLHHWSVQNECALRRFFEWYQPGGATIYIAAFVLGKLGCGQYPLAGWVVVRWPRHAAGLVMVWICWGRWHVRHCQLVPGVMLH